MKTALKKKEDNFMNKENTFREETKSQKTSIKKTSLKQTTTNR